MAKTHQEILEDMLGKLQFQLSALFVQNETLREENKDLQAEVAKLKATKKENAPA